MAFLLGLREACTETVVETTSKGLAWDAATDMCTETFEDRTTWTTSTGDLIAGPTASDRVESVSADRCCRQGVDEAEGLAQGATLPAMLDACLANTVEDRTLNTGAMWLQP